MIISKTPLRISLAGGGSDLPAFYQRSGGSVISGSIDKYVYVIIKERFDDKIYINYSEKEIVNNIDDIKHDLVRECLRKTGITKGVEITTLSDIPSSGTGLGSSSAITVGLLNAFYNYKNILVSKEDLAKMACEIEIDICKSPIGKQDQYGCAIGGINKINFNTNGEVTYNSRQYDMKIIAKSFYLYYTGITRSANSILEKQSKNNILKKSENEKLIKSVEDLDTILKNKKYNDIGPFLDKNWQIKKRMSDGISNQSIEDLYTEGINSGATGGKVLGAGGGGFILFYVPRKNQENFENNMKHHNFLEFKFENHGTKIIFVEG